MNPETLIEDKDCVYLVLPIGIYLKKQNTWFGKLCPKLKYTLISNSQLIQFLEKKLNEKKERKSS